MKNSYHLISIFYILHTSNNNKLNTIETIKQVMSKANALGSNFKILRDCATALHTNLGKLHWHALLKAWAFENGTFMIALAQTGIYINNS